MSQNQIAFTFIVPVWGDEYSKLFSEVCLPLMMTRRNLGARKNNLNDEFVIATRACDAAYLSEQPVMVRLRQLTKVRFLICDKGIELSRPYESMSYCYATAIKSSKDKSNKHYFVFLTPDSFWSDGTIERLSQLAAEGYLAVMALGLRTNRETLEKILKKIIDEKPEDPSFPIEELVSLAIKNIHRLSDAHDCRSTGGFLNSWPSHLYWKVGDSLVAHCFHLHPLMVCGQGTSPEIGDTIDGEFLDRLDILPKDFYIVKGNDDFLGIELSPIDRGKELKLGPLEIKKIKKFSFFHANRVHQHFFRHRIFYQGQNFTQNELAGPLQFEIDELVGSINPVLARDKGVDISKMTQVIFHLGTGLNVSSIIRKIIKVREILKFKLKGFRKNMLLRLRSE